MQNQVTRDRSIDRSNRHLELGHAVNCLERTEDAEHAKRFDRVQVLAGRLAAAKGEREQSAYDHRGVEYVPNVAKVRARMQYDAHVDDLFVCVFVLQGILTIQVFVCNSFCRRHLP